MEPVPFPREAYYQRIGAAKALLPLLSPHGKPPSAASQTLRFVAQLMLAHTTSIPFDPLDALLGRKVSLNPQDIYNKLIHARRGGYCFEQNRLFYEVLRDAGFTDVRPVAARVIYAGENTPMGRSHLLNILTLPSPVPGAAPEQWLIDVGFGCGVTRAPLRLHERAPQYTLTGYLRVRSRDPCPTLTGGWTEFVLEEQLKDKTWHPAYHFDLQPQWPRDFYMMNFVVNHESVFTGNIMASRCVGVWLPSEIVKQALDKQKEGGAAAAEQEGDPFMLTADTGYTYVPRGTYTAVAMDESCEVGVKAPSKTKHDALLALPEVGGALTPSRHRPASPGELYDWMAAKLAIDFAQTTLPQYSVTKAEFETAAKARLKRFGGTGFAPPHHL